MAFGLVCVGSRTGLIPQMLEEGRGVCVAPGDAAALAAALWELTRNPDRCAETSRRAAAWSTQYSLESLRDALRGLMEECWGVRLIQSRGAAALCLPDARTR
jgi:glycosyltransferase involved in cell wall biosynthesis